MNDETNVLCIIVCVLLQQYMFIKYMWLDYNSLILPSHIFVVNNILFRDFRNQRSG
jgi:hypothetical protein